jgi:glycosyltransferase involved in cell wall biosynthesis
VYEGFGLVLLEAMTLGVACISTNCPSGPAEILGDGQFGKLVPMRDPHALADAMLELISLPDLRKKLATLGLQRATELGLGAMASQYFALFDQLQSPSPAESA